MTAKVELSRIMRGLYLCALVALTMVTMWPFEERALPKPIARGCDAGHDNIRMLKLPLSAMVEIISDLI